MAGGGGQNGHILKPDSVGQHPSAGEVEAVGDDDNPVPEIDARLRQALGGEAQVLVGVVGLGLQNDILPGKAPCPAGPGA